MDHDSNRVNGPHQSVEQGVEQSGPKEKSRFAFCVYVQSALILCFFIIILSITHSFDSTKLFFPDLQLFL